MNFDYYVKYFKMLEDRLATTEKFVAFEKENINTYSIEFASIIFDCCNLINGFCSELCREADINKKNLNITDFKKYLLENKYNTDTCVYCRGFKCQPWENFKSEETKISWWEDYNLIKHTGEINFHKATLKNAISSMAGMFLLLFENDMIHSGSTMCNWHGLFDYAGNIFDN